MCGEVRIRLYRAGLYGAIIGIMQNILPVLCFIAGFALAWLIWHGRSAARAADLQARLETERKSADEKLALLEDTRQKLSDSFKALSADALARNNQAFLELASATLAKTQETARGDLELRQQAIAEIVTPGARIARQGGSQDSGVGEGARRRLRRTQRAGTRPDRNAIAVARRDRQAGDRAAHAERARTLGRDPIAPRGGDGGHAGPLRFHSQTTLFGEDGRLRPDLLVRLPAGKTIVVDAKTPLDGYLQAIEAPDEETRKARLADHARQVRGHMTSLARKSYWDQFDQAPEFAVLFLPGECFFSAALESDPS